ncbi:Transcription factor jumonji [Haliangium ochraceum DSM 14365]|uniref:Transcription factor jumonji n=2 Tax=Haliangium ochraceum TaxID=80816 RepID=D0LTG4_HALO1|nr:Transcription factor jumonji [Haliangium ochraceum DSM 14365]
MIDPKLRLSDTLATVTRRVKQFEPEVCRALKGHYHLCLHSESGSQRNLFISIGEESARLVDSSSAEVDLRLKLRETDFVSLIAGSTDPFTLFTNERLLLHDGRGNAVPFAAGRRLLQTLLVEWRIDSTSVAAIEAHAARLAGRTHVDRVTGCEADEFFARYARPGVPVILGGMARDWPLTSLDPQTLGERFGGYQVAVFSDLVEDAGTSNEGKQAVQTSGRVFTNMPLREFIQMSFSGPRRLGDLSRVTPYITAHSLPDELLEWIEYPPFFPREAFVRPKMWMGPSHTETPLHRDLIDNFLAQVWGFKQMRLISPAHTAKLYAIAENLNPYYQPSQLDADRPDLAQFPMCADVPYTDCVLSPGDILYLPAGWWHRVRSLEPSLSVNFFALNQAPSSISSTSA